MEHEVWIPALHRDLTNGQETVQVVGSTLGELIANLDALFPGLADRLTEDGRVRPYISVAVNGEVVSRRLGERLDQPSEIHFVPAIGGG
jgi:molybdopterin synthase sulfur carrier subunit